MVGVLATACTVTSDPQAHPTRVQTGTIGDLQKALARWHQVAATVVYRTARQQPGLPSSAHQCLRRFVDDRADIPIGLAKCDPAGVARLVWDPPARWRLEVTEADRTISATVVGKRSVVCARANGGDERCRRRSRDRLVRSFPFHELVTSVRSVELDIDALEPVTVTHRLVGTAAATVRTGVEWVVGWWCFGSDGTLLSLELRAEGRAPTSVEVTRISSDVRRVAFGALARRSGAATAAHQRGAVLLAAGQTSSSSEGTEDLDDAPTEAAHRSWLNDSLSRCGTLASGVRRCDEPNRGF